MPTLWGHDTHPFDERVEIVALELDRTTPTGDGTLDRFDIVTIDAIEPAGDHLVSDCTFTVEVVRVFLQWTARYPHGGSITQTEFLAAYTRQPGAGDDWRGNQQVTSAVLAKVPRWMHDENIRTTDIARALRGLTEQVTS